MRVARLRGLPLSIFLSVCAGAFFLAPTSNGDVTCLLRIHTGQACPGCGMSRATGSLFRGDLAAAVAYHPYVLAIFGQAALFGLWWYKNNNRPLSPKQSKRFIGILAGNSVMVVLIWLVRIATGHLDGVY